jgi:hypothetical protein
MTDSDPQAWNACGSRDAGTPGAADPETWLIGE